LSLFIFDVGGVLYKGTSVIPEIADNLKVPRERFLEIAVKSGVMDLQAGKITERDFCERFLDITGIPLDKEIWVKFFSPEPVEANIELLKELATEYTVVAGTNTIESHFLFHLNRGDYRFFHRVYASHIIGIAKPDTQFFEYILRKERVEPEQVFFVDDTLKNVQSATLCGIKALHYTNPAELKNATDRFLSRRT